MMAEHAFLKTINEELVLGGPWPGIQLYYPPVKYNPAQGIYETMEQAAERMRKYARECKAHTLLFDLEDGCRQKDMSRDLLRPRRQRFERDAERNRHGALSEALTSPRSSRHRAAAGRRRPRRPA